MQAIGQITTKRLNNTTNGNPRYAVTMVQEDGTEVTGNTKGDSSFSYSMPKSGNASCTWYVTPSGRVVFTNIDKV